MLCVASPQRYCTSEIAVTYEARDSATLLDLLQQAITIAKGMRLSTLEYLLDMAVIEATEQSRVLEGSGRSRT